MFIFLIIGLIAGAFIIIFALQNIVTVSLVFLSWQFEGSLALIIVLAVVAGMVIGSLLSLPSIFHKKVQISKLKNRNLELKDNNLELKDALATKKVEVEEEKNKVAATNAYIDDLENNPKI